MRTSFLTILALVSVALVNGAPTVVIPTLAKGGDATSGYSGNVGGGSVYNSGGFVLNTAFANQGGKAGLTSSGIAVGGNGAGGGGSATSGSTGTAYGGDVQNYGGAIVNGYKSNQAGNGGIAVSGAAIGGNAWKRTTSTLSFGKGGDAKSGYSGSVDGGNVFNSGGFVLNTAFANQGGKAGLTQSGIAVGGNGLGGGGSATSGSTGNAYGGDVQNYGSVIVNGYKSSTSYFPFRSSNALSLS